MMPVMRIPFKNVDKMVDVTLAGWYDADLTDGVMDDEPSDLI